MALDGLKKLRIASDLTLEKLSGEIGISVSQLSRYESGKRDPALSHLIALADYFNVNLDEITGQRVMLPVVGYVGGGAEIFNVDDGPKGTSLDHIPAPPGVRPGAIAVRVKGDSMFPAFNDGDYIIYDDRLEGREIAKLLNRECVVQLADGRMFVKTLRRGSTPGTWSLWSYNASPMDDVLVEWAARVRWIERAP